MLQPRCVTHEVLLECQSDSGLTTIVDLWPSDTCAKATLGVSSVNFCTVDFGGAFFNWSYCVLCVLSNTFEMHDVIFCVKEADYGLVTLVAHFAPWFSE